jgi:hypothetical protein
MGGDCSAHRKSETYLQSCSKKKKSWREDGLEDLGADGILKLILNEFGPLAGVYEHGNEFSVSIRDREMYDQADGTDSFWRTALPQGIR